MDLAAADKIGAEMADALGLKHCRRIDIQIKAKKIVTVTAEFYPEVDGIMQFPAMLKKFKLVPIPDPEEMKGKA